jgi:hypothetical protein
MAAQLTGGFGAFIAGAFASEFAEAIGEEVLKKAAEQLGESLGDTASEWFEGRTAPAIVGTLAPH